MCRYGKGRRRDMDRALRRAGLSHNPIKGLEKEGYLARTQRDLYALAPDRPRRQRQLPQSRLEQRLDLEPGMTKAFWKRHTSGAALVFEYPLATCRVDGVVILGERRRVIIFGERPLLKGRSIIAIETKKGRLDRRLIGQGICSRELALEQGARKVRVVLLCREGDAALLRVTRKLRVEVWQCDPFNPGRCQQLRATSNNGRR
jgi:hypothetical protein